MASEIGISNLKEMVGFGLSMGEGVAALVDGGPSLFDLAKFIEAAKRAIPAFRDVDQILPELQDLDITEKEELKKFVVEDFDIPFEMAESTIETVLCFLVDFADLLQILDKSKSVTK